MLATVLTASGLAAHWLGGEVPVYIHRYVDRSTEHRARDLHELQPAEEAFEAAAKRSGDRHATGGHPATERAKSRPVMLRIVQARKPGSKPYLSLNIPKALPDPDADRKVKAFLQEDDAEPSNATG